MPCLYFFGKMPDWNDALAIEVMIGVIVTAIDFRRDVGIGSRRQDLEGELMMTRKTSSLVTGLNLEKVSVSLHT